MELTMQRIYQADKPLIDSEAGRIGHVMKRKLNQQDTIRAFVWLISQLPDDVIEKKLRAVKE